jgi:hypothetical protein
VPVAALTVAKLSWLHRSEPDNWTKVAHVVLPHDWMTLRLTGELVTDRGDASGTGYWSASTGEYRWDILSIIDKDLDWSDVVPRVAGPTEVVGEWKGAKVACGTGDNMAAALGLGLAPGVAVLSLGTSGTAYAVCDLPTADPSGAVAGFADASGSFLPLACTLNATKVTDAFARLLGVDHAEFDRLALAAPAGAGGLTLLPYFDGERTPNLPKSTGLLAGLRSDASREQIARAAVEGVVCGLLGALDALGAQAPLEAVRLVGGGRAAPPTAGRRRSVRPPGDAGRRRRGRAPGPACRPRQSHSVSPTETSSPNGDWVSALRCRPRQATSPASPGTQNYDRPPIHPPHDHGPVRRARSRTGRNLDEVRSARAGSPHSSIRITAATPSRWARSTSPSTQSFTSCCIRRHLHRRPSHRLLHLRRRATRVCSTAPFVHDRHVAGGGVRGVAGGDVVDRRGVGRRSAVRPRSAPRRARSLLVPPRSRPRRRRQHRHLTVASIDGIPAPDVELVRDTWVANLNRL